MSESDLTTSRPNRGEPTVDVPAHDDWFTDNDGPRIVMEATSDWYGDQTIAGKVRDEDEAEADEDIEETTAAHDMGGQSIPASESEAAADWGLSVTPVEPPRTAQKGFLAELAEECQRRLDAREDDADVSAWIKLDPPTEQQMESRGEVLGNYDGKPVKPGAADRDLTDDKQDEDPSIVEYRVFRTGKYNLHYRVRRKVFPNMLDWTEVTMTDFNGEATVTVPDEGPLAGTLHLVATHEPIQGDPVEGWFTSDDTKISARKELSVGVEGDIEPGEDVIVTVTDSNGDPMPNTAIYQKGPTTGMSGEVFVEEAGMGAIEDTAGNAEVDD